MATLCMIVGALFLVLCAVLLVLVIGCAVFWAVGDAIWRTRRELRMRDKESG